MTNVAIWFERKFTFPIPVELLPNVLARLRGTPARLEESLRGHSAEVLTRKVLQKWSIQEHAGHLLDLEPLWLSRVNDYVTGEKQLTTADLTNHQTHQANHNTHSLVQILSDFRDARQKLLSRVSELEPALFSQAIPHPRLGTPLQLIDHLYFVAEHDDHHLAMMWNLFSIYGV